jgi:hypothetical protein
MWYCVVAHVLSGAEYNRTCVTVLLMSLEVGTAATRAFSYAVVRLFTVYTACMY